MAECIRQCRACNGGKRGCLKRYHRGLMAQGIRVEQAAPLGVYLHGKAGEAAGARRSMRGMTASDIHDGMCEILAGLEQTQSQPGKDGIS